MKSSILICLALVVFSAWCDNPEERNLLANPSFEAAGTSEDQAKNWDSSIYKPGKRIAGEAADGKFCYSLTGDGSAYVAVRQSIPGKEIPSTGKLVVSCYAKVNSYQQGVIKPIHFILISDGKASYPVGATFSQSQNPIGQWYRCSAIIELEKYGKIDRLDVFSLGWDWQGKFLIGSFLVDNFTVYHQK